MQSDPNVRADPPGDAEELAALAVAAARGTPNALESALDTLSAPIYATDDKGIITYFNAACVDFAGRTPAVGQDRWCVTWRLYSEDGIHLPHDECPMAVAVRENRPVRGAVAIAERPDGTRVLFTPFPTPVTDESGALVGAVNILIDITEPRQIAALEEQALRCRRLAASVTDDRTVRVLGMMADDYEAKARALSPAAGHR